jgi:epoxide hydrolase-like predicted phosphatase
VQLRAVIFDLGGVVVPSPIAAFRSFEKERGLPHRFISEVIVSSGEHGAWSKLERGELTLEEFGAAFEKECEAAGEAISADDMLACLYRSGGVNDGMVVAIGRIRARGLRTAALTNNWGTDDDESISESRTRIMELFDVVVESHREGLRKPDRRIYELVCDRLGVAPPEAAFLDDLGANLKPARAMGMTTIKVDDPDDAVMDLEAALGFPLRDGD